ncbi:MAG TPA: class I SAM-dependent methyltransferase [Nitrospiria bacterium]|nr:class I SAM-dependent methyltransferase [Nitrospiria bacterium]
MKTDLYQEQKEYFRQAYVTGEHGWPIHEATSFVLRALRQIRKKKGKAGRVLDLGCGEGRHTLAAAREGFEAVGLDYQPLALKKARVIAQTSGVRGRFRFLAGDAFNLPLRPGSFDAVIDYGCLHHVKMSDTRRYAESVFPLLPPGGHFILSCFSTRFKHHPGEKRKRNWICHKGHYDRFFRKSDFKDLFGRWFNRVMIEEERDGHYAFWHVLMEKKAGK